MKKKFYFELDSDNEFYGVLELLSPKRRQHLFQEAFKQLKASVNRDYDWGLYVAELSNGVFDRFFKEV